MTYKNFKTARIASQVIFFLLLAVFLVGTFCSVSLGGAAYLSCPLGVIELTLGAREIIWGTVFSGVLLLGVTIVLGRVFCGWVCPFGALLDALQKPLAKFRSARASLPAALTSPDNKVVKYGILGGVLASAGIWRSPVFCAICPIGTTCRTAGLQGINMGLETAILPLIAGLEIVGKRFWCKILCPVGALLAITSRFSLLRIRLPWSHCAGCDRCEQACSMNNAPHYAGHDKLKTDPEVLAMLMQYGMPDLLDRPAQPDSLPAPLRELLDRKNKSMSVANDECTRCCSCLAACPVLQQTSA